MIESFVDKSTKEVPDTIKQSIGKLIVVNAGETDPARKIHYASALITHIRSALVYIANHTENRTFMEYLHSLIYNILKAEYDPKGLGFAFNRIRQLFIDEPRTKYDMELLKDLALIQQCRNNWKKANSMYFSNSDAWQFSNEMLADIQDTLVEVAIRWNLVIIPKDAPFNISSIPNIAYVPPAVHEQLED